MMNSYQQVVFEANLTFSWSNPYTGGTVVVDINDILPQQAGLQVMLPLANYVNPGASFLLNNVSRFSLTVIDVTLEEIAVFAPGDVKAFYLIDTSNAAGKWRVIPYGGGTNAMTSLTLESPDKSVLIEGGDVSPPGGVVEVALPSSLSTLTRIQVPGIVIAQEVAPLSFSSVSLEAGDNIAATNPDGVSGNPLIALSRTLTQLTSLETQGLHIEGNTLTALNNDLTNGNLALQSAGEKGVISLNPVTIDPQGNLGGIKDLSLSGTLSNAFIPKAWCVFVDTGQTTGNIILQDGANVASVTGGQGMYVITFSRPLANANYGFSIDVQKSSGSNFVSEVFMQSRNASSCIVYTTDIQGNLIAAIDGVSVTILSSPSYAS